MHLKIPIIAIASLAVGVLIGRYLPASTPAGASDHANPRSESRPTRAESRLGNPVDSSVSGGRETMMKSNGKTAVTDSSADRTIVPISIDLISRMSHATGRRKLEQDLFNGDGAVEEALQITDHEKAIIQSAWRASLREIRGLEVGVIQSEAIDEWSHRIVVPEMDASIAPLGARFSSQVMNALGAERGGLFLAAKQVGRMFAEPTGERVYLVTTEEVGDGNWRFRVELKGADEARTWVGGNLPDEIRHLTDAVGIASSVGE